MLSCGLEHEAEIARAAIGNGVDGDVERLRHGGAAIAESRGGIGLFHGSPLDGWLCLAVDKAANHTARSRATDRLV
jgi:hypothetical protein